MFFFNLWIVPGIISYPCSKFEMIQQQFYCYYPRATCVSSVHLSKFIFMVVYVGEKLCLWRPTQWVPSCVKQNLPPNYFSSVKIHRIPKNQRKNCFNQSYLSYSKCHNILELPTMHLFEMSVISSPGTEGILACMSAL